MVPSHGPCDSTMRVICTAPTVHWFMVFAPPRASGDAPPAVHVETHTGQERRVVRGGEENGGRQVARLAEPPGRDGGEERPAELVREPVEAGRGLHEAGLGGDGVHRVDANRKGATSTASPRVSVIT